MEGSNLLKVVKGIVKGFMGLLEGFVRLVITLNPKPLIGFRARAKRQWLTWRARGLSKSVISRVIIRVTPFRVLITTYNPLTKSPGPPSRVVS